MIKKFISAVLLTSVTFATFSQKNDEIIKDLASQKKNLDELIFKYYKKLIKTVGIKPAAQFYQIENYFISAIRLEILKNISFTGEI